MWCSFVEPSLYCSYNVPHCSIKIYCTLLIIKMYSLLITLFVTCYLNEEKPIFSVCGQPNHLPLEKRDLSREKNRQWCGVFVKALRTSNFILYFASAFVLFKSFSLTYSSIHSFTLCTHAYIDTYKQAARIFTYQSKPYYNIQCLSRITLYTLLFSLLLIFFSLLHGF